jgi:hypothetical protein
MEIIEQINKTREYLDYIEEHILNVQKAWNVMEEKCVGMKFITDDLFYHTLASQIDWHDLSKLSEQEFVQYRKAFYPTVREGKHSTGDAWEHHKTHNPHHWENWTANTGCTIHPDDWEIDCAHMVCDWMAMGYKFGDTAQQYYEANKDKIKLSKIAIDFIYEIFDRIKEQ